MNPSTTTLSIEFIEVAMLPEARSSCSACDTVRARLETAVGTLSPAFAALGLEPRVEEKVVRTAEEATRLQVRASPTIRIEGVELAPEHRGEDGELRIWRWKDEEHSSPSQGLLVAALIDGARSGESEASSYELPDYLARHLASVSEARQGAPA